MVLKELNPRTDHGVNHYFGRGAWGESRENGRYYNADAVATAFLPVISRLRRCFRTFVGVRLLEIGDVVRYANISLREGGLHIHAAAYKIPLGYFKSQGIAIVTSISAKSGIYPYYHLIVGKKPIKRVASIAGSPHRILFSGDVCIERAFLRTKQSKASKCILHLNHKPHTDSLELVNEFAKTLIANPAISLILPGHGDVLSLTGESIGSSGLEEREYFEKRWEDNRLLVIDKQLCPYKMKYLEIVKGSDLSFEGRKAILGEFKVLIDQGLIWKSFILNTIDELGNGSELWNYCYFVLDGNSLAGYLKAHDNYLIEVFVIPGDLRISSGR